MFSIRKLCVLWGFVAVIFTVVSVEGQLAVRHPEGLAHGFLVVRTMDGEAIAYGELTQNLQKGGVTSRLVFHFKDGSSHDETVVFSQRRSFRILRYKLIQKGPSFPHPTTLSFDTSSGQVSVQSSGDDGKQQSTTEHMSLPPDVANGIIFMLMKNVADDTEVHATMLVTTPKPRLAKLTITREGEDTYVLGGEKRAAKHYVVKIELGGITGVLAKVVGKEPPDIHGWIIGGNAPAFLKSQGPMYAGGPSWIVELESPVWPHTEEKK